MKKKEISKQELYKLYIEKNMMVLEIANIYNVSKSFIEKELRKNNIKKSKELWAKNYKNIILNKYGVENISQLSEIKQKKKDKSVEKYGVDNPMKATKVKEKIKRNNIEKYGVENPMQLKEVQDKLKKKINEKYGKEFALQVYDFQKKYRNTMNKRYGKNNPSKIKEMKIKIINTNIDKYGVPYACMLEQCKNANGYTRSKINREFSQKLNELEIKNEQEFNIGKYSFDIKLKNSNILVEINPTYTHNSTIGINFRNHYKQPTEIEYHYNKTLKAKENGYKCIHVFDWDSQEKIINMLKPKEKIYARNLDCKEISQEEATDFLEKYHLQGSCRGQKVRAGLFYNDELVEIMTFGKPRYNKKYEWELLRLCSHSDYKIVGGANKLFKHFLIDYKPQTIISYCDNSKFDGDVYKILGFKLLDYGKPSKHWYNMKTKQHITDNLLRQRGFDQLFGTHYGKGTSNNDLMIENGFVEVYDSGQSIYAYEMEDING